MDCCDGDSLAAACFDWQRAAIQWEERALKAEEELQSARGQIEALKGKVLQLQQMVFGRKSEKQEGQHPEAKPESGDAAETGAAAEELGGKRSRGQQRGAPGHGRRKHTELPEEPVIHDLPPEQRHCPHCGKAFAPLSGDETSEEIDWEVIVRRRVHHRRRYHRTCQCPQTPAITVAPGPPKLIPKGIFAVNAVTDLLVQKFLLARPTNKTISLLNLRSGLELSPGTVAGVMEKLHPLLAPLEAAIVERGRSAHHWHADETRWKVFEAVEGKENFNWWLWVFASADTVVYLLDPRRSGTVPKGYFQKGVDGDLAGAGSQGILSRDRWAAYNGLEGILTQYCWAHERRDFIDAACSFPKLGSWRDAWLERIRELYRLHGQREQAPAGSDAFALADGPLRAHVASMAVVRDAELAEATNPGAEKVLRSMVKNWNGLTLFLDYPGLPLDNNEAERLLRTPVLGRNNFWGSGAVWSGHLAASVFTVLGTAAKNGLNPITYLNAYFNACAEAEGKAPDNIKRFLPWEATEEDLQAWSRPPQRASEEESGHGLRDGPLLRTPVQCSGAGDSAGHHPPPRASSKPGCHRAGVL